MASPSEVSPNDLLRYQSILQRFENGESLSAFAGAIKELAKTYKTSHPTLKALSRIMAEVRYQEELANKMQTFASMKDRSESELFDEQAITVRDRFAQAGQADRLPLDAFTATFLGLEEKTYLTTDLHAKLSSLIAEQYDKQARDLVVSGFRDGVIWEHIAQRLKSLRVRLEQIVPSAEAETTLVRFEKLADSLVVGEEKLTSDLSKALLQPTPTNLESLAALLRDIEVDSFESARRALLANRIARSLKELTASLRSQLSRERLEETAKWTRRLERLRARTEGEGWTDLLDAQRMLVRATLEQTSQLRDTLSRLLDASLNADTRVRSEQRSNGLIFNMPSEAFRRSWSSLELPIRDLLAWLESLAAVERQRLELIPRNPPKVDAAASTWKNWIAETRKRLGELLTASGANDAGPLATDAMATTQRELDAWQIRQRTSAEVVQSIDSGAPWERVADIATKAQQPKVAEAIRQVMAALERANDWREIEGVCASLDATNLSLAMYTLSKSDKGLERLRKLIMDSLFDGDGGSKWLEPWFDALDQESSAWVALVRYVEQTRETLNAPAGQAMEALLELSFEGQISHALADAHRALRGLRTQPDVEGIGGEAGGRARKLLAKLEHERERAEAGIEARMAFHAALALVPLNDEITGTRPQWTTRSDDSWQVHLSREWLGLLKASDDFYWQIRALAPYSRKTAYKREFALLGLPDTLHLSPMVLEDLAANQDGASAPPPTPSDILQAALVLERAIGSVTANNGILRGVRMRLERQLKQICLSLLALDLENPGDECASTARWIAMRVAPGLGAPASTRPQLLRLLRFLDDGEWVAKRARVLDGVHGALRAELIEALDIGLARPGMATDLPTMVRRLVDADPATIDAETFAAILSEVLAFCGTTPISNQGGRVLLNFAMTSLQEFIKRQIQDAAAETRQRVLATLRRGLFEAPDDERLKQRLEQLRLLDPMNEPTHALKKYLFGA